MTLVQPATFELASTEKHSFGRIETGTVEVTLGRETRRVRATRWFTNDERYEVEIHAYDLGGRYENGLTTARKRNAPTLVATTVRAASTSLTAYSSSNPTGAASVAPTIRKGIEHGRIYIC
jgi:hypothetical protein